MNMQYVGIYLKPKKIP